MTAAQHVWDSWQAFATFCDQSNWSGLFMGLLIPTVPLGWWTHVKHKRTHEHLDDLHRKVDRLHQHVTGEEPE